MSNGKKYSPNDVEVGAFGYCIGETRASFGMVVGTSSRKRFLILDGEPASPINILYDIFVVQNHKVVVDVKTYAMARWPGRMSVVIMGDELHFLIEQNRDSFTIINVLTGETKLVEIDTEVYCFSKWSIVDTSEPNADAKFKFEVRPLV